MKIIKTRCTAGIFILLLMSVSAQATSQKLDVSQASKNEKIAKALANLSAKIDAMPKSEKKLESNFSRIKDLDALFGKFVANFDKTFTKKIATYKKIHSKMVPLQNIFMNYDLAKNTNNPELKFMLQDTKQAPPQFNQSFLTWFNSIRKNQKLLDTFVDIFPIPISDKTKNSNPHLANATRGLLVFLKVPFNIKRVLLYLDKSGNVTLAEANGIVYDFANNIKVEVKTENPKTQNPVKTPIPNQVPAVKTMPVINKK